jgi:X-X-X-Leu-X-X-Gly heptad repeat protein
LSLSQRLQVVMAKRQQSILFITNSELGQSTVTLAVAHEFLLRPEYDVHIASFSPLQDAISELNDQAATLSSGTATTATFHTIAGKSMKEAAGRKTEFIEMHPPGISGAIFAYQRVLPATFASWNGAEYMIGYSSCVEIINSVRPDLVAVDPLFSQGIDACTSLGLKFIILSPNTFKDHVIREQPKGGALWKYPQ